MTSCYLLVLPFLVRFIFICLDKNIFKRGFAICLNEAKTSNLFLLRYGRLPTRTHLP